MTVLVDTPVWSIALRRRMPDLNVRERVLTGPFRSWSGRAGRR